MACVKLPCFELSFDDEVNLICGKETSQTYGKQFSMIARMRKGLHMASVLFLISILDAPVNAKNVIREKYSFSDVLKKNVFSTFSI